MKIVHVITSLRKGGAERLCLSICKEFSAIIGVNVKIVLVENTIEYDNIPENVEVLFFDSKINLSIWKQNVIKNEQYRKFIDMFEPDVVHSHLIRGNILALSYLKSNIKYYIHVHGQEPVLRRFSITNFSKRAITNLYEKFWLLKNIKKIHAMLFACSEGVEDFLVKNIALKKMNVILLPNAIDLRKFKCDTNHNEFTELNLINVATLSEAKNHSFLIDVAACLKRKKIKFKLNIFGDGSKRTYLQKKIYNLDLQDCVFLRGSVNNIEECYAHSNIYLQTSIREGLPMVFIEAMACGLPIITTKYSRNIEIIRDGINGFIVEQGDKESYVERILYLANNPDVLLRMKEKALQMAKHFDVEKYVDKLIKIYSQDLN